MRWVKHLTMAHADIEMDHVLEEFGAEAYGVYWLMIEDIAAPMEKGKFAPVASHSAVKWASICRCSVRHWKSIAYRLAEKSLIVIRSNEDRFEIEIPNILKYKDEYSKKSGQTPEQDRETDIDGEQKENISANAGKKTPASPAAPPALTLIPPPSEPKETDKFEEFWALYPRKVGKSSARKSWKRKADSVRAAEEIIFGLKAHTPALLLKDLEFRPHAATWLNQERWKDPIEQPEARASPNSYVSRKQAERDAVWDQV